MSYFYLTRDYFDQYEIENFSPSFSMLTLMFFSAFTKSSGLPEINNST
jgi:hypothetical protein